MKSIRFLIVLALVSAGLVSWDGDSRNGDRPLDVYLKRVCYPSGDRLRLSDVIQSSGANGYSLDYDSILLPHTAGRLAVLRPQAVREALKTVFSGPLVLVGRDMLVIPTESVAAGGELFYTALLDFIAGEIPHPAERIEVQFENDSMLAAARPDNPIFAMGNAVMRDGLKTGPVRITLSEGSTGNADSIGVVLHVFVAAAVPSAAIPAGGRFQAGDLEARETDLVGCDSDLLLFERADGAYTARSYLAANEPISLRKISRALFVRAGDRVAITFVRKNVTVDLRGRALSSGSLEETVAVKPDQSGRRFTARVTGEREVLIELE